MNIDSEHSRRRCRGIELAVAAAFATTTMLSSCGGSEKKVEEPEPRESLDDPDEDLDSGEEIIAPEILDSIQRTFARKQTVVARCFVEGIDAGEYPKTARGYVTVGATITPAGRAKGATVLKASLRSKVLHACITGLVKSWDFAAPPRNVETSFTYSLERL